MNETPIDTILGRINDTLENRIAPELVSPVLRGQVIAVVELLNQLAGKVEYRRDLLTEDIERARETIAMLLDVFDAARIAVPDELRAAAAPFDPATAIGGELLEARRRARASISTALELLDANRARVADADAVESRVLDRLQQGVMRDILLFRPQRFDKISQRDEE